MRAKEKIDQNKLRTFTASPFRFSVLLNVLCLAMNVGFYAAGQLGKVWSCVGISKYSRGWNKIGQRLHKHPNVFDLDVSSFDASLFQFLFTIILKFRITCLVEGKKWARLMKRVYQTIVFAYIVLISGTVIRKRTGNPSGSSNTVVDNTLILFLLLCYCWVVLVPEELNSYAAFMSNVEALLYGDDNTFSVSDEAVQYYNPVTISGVMKSLGLSLTAGDDKWTAKSIFEVQFLSNSFVKHGEMYFPKPDYDKLLCSLLYGSRVNDVRWHLLRAHALLMDGFWNKEFRELIRQYIVYLYTEYKNKLIPGVVKGDITWEHVKGLQKSDLEIFSLYMSYESASIIKISDIDRGCSNGDYPVYL
jgi:hypothetical protein